MNRESISGGDYDVSEASLRQAEEDVFSLQGDLDFDTVTGLRGEAESLFDVASEHITLDMCAVRRTSSVGLALLVDWHRRAHKSGKSIAFINAPAQLIAMAELSQLDRLLDIRLQDSPGTV